MKRKFIKTGTIGKALLTVATVGTIFVATPNAVQAADIDDAPKDNNVSVAKPTPEKPAPKSDDKPGPKDENKPGENKPGENKPGP
ncbi:MAG: hypothetical protein MJ245_07605, partial [Clostridia bacterium]|nr:hypothetical protein [Clostridia bacterium]